MGKPDCIVERLGRQIEKAREEYARARLELDNVIECFIRDIRDNMDYYISNNIRREIRKKPALAENLSEESFSAAQAEISEAVKIEIESITGQLRDFPGWYNDSTVYLDTSTHPWKAVKSVETPVNRILKKNGLGPIDMKNWNWLSVETNELVTTRFSEIKNRFIDKAKQLKYIETRYNEEVKIGRALEKLENL